MNPLEPLIEEHRQIRIVISAITALLGRTAGETGLSPRPFLELEYFIQRFADGAHHAKEEQVLFFEMVQAGIPTDRGPLDCMINEHEHGRKYAAVIGAAARACLDGDWRREADMRGAAHAWCRLLTDHTRKEDQVVYAIAQKVIRPEILAQLPARFGRVDPAPAGAFRDSARAVVVAASFVAHPQHPTG